MRGGKRKIGGGKTEQRKFEKTTREKRPRKRSITTTGKTGAERIP